MSEEILKALSEELKEHRKMFTEVRTLISEQNVNLGKLSVTIDNLADSIKESEGLKERITILEQWKVAHKLEEKVNNIEEWKTKLNLQVELIRDKFKIGVSLFIAAVSVIAYAIDKVIAFFSTGG